MTDLSTGFTVEGYRALIEGLVQRGFTPTTFTGEVSAGRQVILRHDLDMSVAAALPIAKVEHDLGVVATYFVLLRTEMYNPFSEASRKGLLHLVELGHAVGLHLDASLYGESPEELDIAAEQECSVLEALLGQRVEVVSFHRPAQRLQGLERLIAGRRHAYQPGFFTDMAYCSDSRGGWHHGHPLEQKAVANGTPLQLLTHPIWWNATEGETVRQKLDRFALGRFDLLRAEIAANCDAYPQEFRSLGTGFKAL